MRSDKDKRTDSEREIDEFLSKFENPSDELSADYSSYLKEKNTTRMTAAQTFYWKNVDSPDLRKIQEDSRKNGPAKPASRPEAAVRPEKTTEPEKAEKAADKKDSAAAAETAAPAAVDPIAEKYPGKKKRRKKKKKKPTPVEAPAAASLGAAGTAAAELSDEKTIVADRSSIKKETGSSTVKDKKAEKKSEKKEKPYKADKAALEQEKAEIDGIAASAEKPEKKEKAVRPEKPEKKPADRKKPKKKKEKKEPAGKAKEKNKIKDKKNKGSIGRTLFFRENKNYDPSLGETYVKDGKTYKNKQYKFSFLKLLRDMVAVGMIFVLAGLVYALAIITVAPKYNYKDIYSDIDTASVVFNDQGKQIDNIFYTENRKIVKYEDMPEDLINSFVAIEDKTFWHHHGFNWTRMFGAILSSLTGSGRISGTSTITQQLARNVYLADTKSVRSIKRKLLEMYYASRLEHSLSKEEIIEAYLNTIYLGHGCYGVYSAAHTYFSKDVKDLSLVECASLAALPQSPDTYALLKLATEAQDAVDSEVVATEPDTVVTNDISRQRRQLTLDLMLSQKYIDESEYNEAYDKTLNDFIKPSLASSGSIYSYFHEYLVDTIINDLMDQYGMEYENAERMVYTKGLQIYSTVDSEAMEIVAKEFQDGSNFPYVTAPIDGDGNMLNNDGQISLYKYSNYFNDKGEFRLSGDAGDVKVGSDGSFTIMKDHKLHIYPTEVDGATDYSLEFRNYYFYDDNDVLYSIAGGYLNIPAAYKTADNEGNVVVDKDFFSDPYFADVIRIEGNDVVITNRAYTLSPRQRQPQAAMTIVGVGTGEVKAMVGGRQFGGQKVLNRSLNPRQPGSSIKPLAVYGAALQKSYDLNKEGKKWEYTNFHIDKQGTKGWGDYVTMHSSIEDERCRIEGRNWPNNFNNSFSGKNTFKTAIQKSINTCAVKLVLQVGSDYSIEQLKKFGLTTVQDDLSDPVNDANPAALGLGAMTQGVEPLEMALAYASFPGGGKVNTPICYTKVLDRNGDVLLEGKSKQSEALNEGVAWIMQEVLRSVVNFNHYMYVTGVSPGGKTGTTNDQYDIWFDGFTPTYAASLWIGTDENVEMSSMSTPAAALWGKIINQIPNAKNGEYSPMPSNVIQKGGEYFTKGTETGLTSWSNKEAKEKAKKDAYNKWLKERENHKKLIPEKGHYEDVYEQVKVKDAWDETVPGKHHDAVPAKTHEEPVLDSEGNPTGETRTVVDVPAQDAYDDPPTTIHHDAVYENRKTGTKWVVDEPEHYEYEKGWRDGDFKYNG